MLQNSTKKAHFRRKNSWRSGFRSYPWSPSGFRDGEGPGDPRVCPGAPHRRDLKRPLQIEILRSFSSVFHFIFSLLPTLFPSFPFFFWILPSDCSQSALVEPKPQVEAFVVCYARCNNIGGLLSNKDSQMSPRLGEEVSHRRWKKNKKEWGKKKSEC